MSNQVQPVPMKQNTEGLRIYRALVTFTTDHKLPEGVWSEAVERSIRHTKQMLVADLVELVTSD